MFHFVDFATATLIIRGVILMTKTMSFTRIIAVFVLMFACLFAFAGCNNLPAFTDNPKPTDTVEGNGTLAVTKGDYVYYTNGFMGYADVGETNKLGNITHTALYRTKLEDNRVVENQPQLDDEGEEIFDKTQGIQHTDVLVSKVCGFEYSALYIFGDYIYYTTPNNQKNKELEVCTDLIDFCRTRIDRSSGQEVLYTTTNPGSAVDFTMYELDGTVYLIVLDGSAGNESSSIFVRTFGKQNKTFTTSDDLNITSFAKATYTSSDQMVSATESDVYFTYTKGTFVDTNTLAKMDLSNGEVTDLAFENGVSYTLQSIVSGKLYYTKATTSTEGAYIYYNTLGASFASTESKLTANDYAEYVPYSHNVGTGVIVYDSDSKCIYKKSTTDVSAILLVSDVTVTSFVGVQGNNVYYIADNNVYCYNYINAGSATSLTADLGSIKIESARNISIIGDKVFYLKEYSNGDNTAHYLHMTNSSIIDDETDKPYDHFLGELAEVDYLDEPTE